MRNTISEREQKVLDLRIVGATWKQIGAMLGVTPVRASQIGSKAAGKLKWINCMNELPKDSIRHTNLPERVKNTLEHAGINTTGELKDLSEAELKLVPHLGNTSINRIKEYFKE